MAQDWPLANDRQGNAFHPEGATKWRVRRRNGKTGPQEPLFHKQTKLPLEVEIDAQPPELVAGIEAAGHSPNGEFLLVPVNSKGQKVGEQYAFIPLGDAAISVEAEGASSSAGNESSAVRGLSEAVHALLKRDEARDRWIVQRDDQRDRWLTRIVETQTQIALQLVKGYADVRPVGEEQAPPEAEAEPEAPEPDMFQKMQQAMPMLMQLADWWRSTQAGVQPQAQTAPASPTNGVGLGIQPERAG